MQIYPHYSEKTLKVYGHWIPSGSAQSAGSLVAAAQKQKWQRLQSILESRTFDAVEDIDDDDGEETEDT